MTDSIFKNTGNDLRELLAQYKPDEILYVSIDVAKYNHSSMIANLFGDVIIPKFDFPYNSHGIDFLRKKVNLAQKQTNAKKVFFGLESTGHYHENLTAALEPIIMIFLGVVIGGIVISMYLPIFKIATIVGGTP